MTRTYADFEKYNFFRQPDWRWERVLELCAPGDVPKRGSSRDDVYVRQGRSFLLAWRQRHETLRDKLRVQQPGLCQAYELATRTDSPNAAFYLQARLLARQEPEEIAKAMGILVETVAWYEALFFNVLDRLDNRDWITQQVLMPSLLRGHHSAMVDSADVPDGSLPGPAALAICQPFLDGTLKFFAYHGGPLLVDLLLANLQVGKTLTNVDEIPAWLDNAISTTLRRRITAQVAMTFEIDNFNVMELFHVHTKIMALERSDESLDGQRSTMERHIECMLDQLPWQPGEQATGQPKNTILSRLQRSEVGKFTDQEVLLLASGEPVPGLTDTFVDERPPRRPTDDGATASPDHSSRR